MNNKRAVLRPAGPHDTPEKHIPDNMIRRLVKFRYTCRLCGATHRAQYYVSTTAASQAKYQQAVLDIYSSEKMPPDAFDGAARILHEQKGDLKRLLDKVDINGLYPPSPPNQIQFTKESQYTCSTCDSTFSTIRDLRKHDRSCR